jgi:tetratricopeptide (TPR) repeat protein
MTIRMRFGLIPVLLGAVLLVGCSGNPEVRKQRFLESGDQYFKGGKFREAAIEYRNAVQIDERFGAARLGLARSQERLGDLPRALAEYIRAADLLPDDREVQLKAGTYLLTARRFDEAKARAEAVLQADARNVEAQVLLGNALAGLRNLDQAITEIEEAIRIDPLRGATYTSLGMLEMNRGRAEAAEKAFKRTVELAPGWVPGHLALANHAWATGKMADAEQSLGKALALEPRNPVTNRAFAVFYITTDRADMAEPYIKTLAASGAAPFALADFYLLRNRPASAIPELQNLRERDRTASEAGRRLAQAYAMRGDFADASRVVDELLQKNDRDAASLLLKGQLLAQQGKRDEAFATLLTASQVDPNSAQLQFALARSHAARGDLDQARQAYTEVLRLNPRAASAQAELARLDLASGRVKASVQLAREAVRNEPANLNAQVALIRSVLASNDAAGAKSVLDPLLAAHPKEPVLHVQQGLILSALKDAAGARRAFTRALELNPVQVEATSGLAALDTTSGDFAAARSRIETALKAQPNNPELLLVAARNHAAAKDLVAAEQALKKALELEPALLAGYTMLGQLYLSQGRLADARREFEALADRHAKPVAALTMLGIIAEMERNAPKAQEHFERAVELDPRAAIAANNLAWLYAEKGDRLDYALQLAQTAVQVLPKAGEAHDTLGWVYFKRNTAGPSIAAFRQAISLSPKNASYHYHLGLAYSLGEEPEHARTSFSQALSLSGGKAPWAADARQKLAVVSSGSR